MRRATRASQPAQASLFADDVKKSRVFPMFFAALVRHARTPAMTSSAHDAAQRALRCIMGTPRIHSRRASQQSTISCALHGV